MKKTSSLLSLCAISIALSACQHHTEILGQHHSDAVPLNIVPVSTSQVVAHDNGVIQRVGRTSLTTPTSHVQNYTTYKPAPTISPNQKLVRALSGFGYQTSEVSQGVLAYLPSSTYFDLGKSTIKPGLTSKLRQLSSETNKPYASHRDIVIMGHTDATGSSQSNLVLSSKRATAVHSKLSQLGTRSSRLRSKGLGESSPRFTDTASQHLNRRVEFLIKN